MALGNGLDEIRENFLGHVWCSDGKDEPLSPMRFAMDDVGKRCVTDKCQERWEQLSSVDARGEVFINFQHVAKEEAKS